jgi:peptidoglycan/LPS O-acetylase OafA/YrhL
MLALVCTTLLLTHNFWPGLALPNKLHLFLAGAVAGMLPRAQWRAPAQRHMLALLQLCALALLAAPAVLYPSHDELYQATELGVAFALAIYLLSVPTRWSTAVLAHPAMRAIGRASFSIYLMHVLVFYFGMRWLGLHKDEFQLLWLPLGAAAVLLPMLVSRAVEMPLQAATRRVLERWSSPQAVVATPLP